MNPKSKKPKAQSTIPKGFHMGGNFIGIDFSRGADNACVVLQPGKALKNILFSLCLDKDDFSFKGKHERASKR